MVKPELKSATYFSDMLFGLYRLFKKMLSQHWKTGTFPYKYPGSCLLLIKGTTWQLRACSPGWHFVRVRALTAGPVPAPQTLCCCTAGHHLLWPCELCLCCKDGFGRGRSTVHVRVACASLWSDTLSIALFILQHVFREHIRSGQADSVNFFLNHLYWSTIDTINWTDLKGMVLQVLTFVVTHHHVHYNQDNECIQSPQRFLISLCHPVPSGSLWLGPLTRKQRVCFVSLRVVCIF